MAARYTARYIAVTKTGNLSLKTMGFLELLEQEECGPDLAEMLERAKLKSLMDAHMLGAVAQEMEEAPRRLRAFIESRYDWLQADNLLRLSEEQAEQAGLISKYLEGYRKQDNWVVVPPSLQGYDRREVLPAPEPEEKPKKAKKEKERKPPAIFDDFPDLEEEEQKLASGELDPLEFAAAVNKKQGKEVKLW